MKTFAITRAKDSAQAIATLLILLVCGGLVIYPVLFLAEESLNVGDPQEFPLQETRQFATDQFSWNLDAKGWKWARVAIWDIAANGAFVNPVWKSE